MFRTTQDVIELRRWAEAHGARPCREERTGRLLLSFTEGAGCQVGWDEFEPTFLAHGHVFVYDDAPGCRRCFVGPPDEARRLVCSAPVDAEEALQ